MGYISIRTQIFDDSDIDGVLKFSQTFAIPVFLFLGIINLDLASVFNWQLLLTFYIGAISCFTVGVMASILIFKSSRAEAIAIGFCILFSNAVFLGLPITELAYGSDALGANFAIISVNAPICYLIGITVMEIFGDEKNSFPNTIQNIFKTITSNTITMSLLLGLAFNLLSVPIFLPISTTLSLISPGAIPIALFGLGGVLARYKVTKKFNKIFLIVILSICIHPLITILIGISGFNLSQSTLRSAVITAAMGPGINAFIFASIYKKEMDVVAAAVLVCAPISIVTTSLWITFI
jgi:malonate transporter